MKPNRNSRGSNWPLRIYGQQKRHQSYKSSLARRFRLSKRACKKGSKAWPLPVVLPDERRARTKGSGLGESGPIIARSSVTRRAFVIQGALSPRCLMIGSLPMWRPFCQLNSKNNVMDQKCIQNIPPNFSPWEVCRSRGQICNCEPIRCRFATFPCRFSYAKLAQQALDSGGRILPVILHPRNQFRRHTSQWHNL